MTSLEKRVRKALHRELSSRGYDAYPADEEIYQEGLDDFTEAVMAEFRKEDENGE